MSKEIKKLTEEEEIDNLNEKIFDLTIDLKKSKDKELIYNKKRQATITNSSLDLIGNWLTN